MAFDQASFAAAAKAAHAAASTPAFTPDPDNSIACAQVEQAVADAKKRAAVHAISMAVGQRVEDLWPGPAADAPAPVPGSLDAVVYAAIAFYQSTVQE
ncbi:hypothetical protein ACQ858_08395 [Variovorax ureilyticus]|uniref:hypothetical protein n=1 Tax=Variovorax ureilyticus TaxID=1836198 RepID=UPI003D66716A